MPLKGQFEWDEKKDHFVLRIPLKGVAPSKVDVFGKLLCPFNSTSACILYN